MYRDACLSKIKSILRKSSCVCIVLMGKYSASHASWASPLRKARTRTAMHGTFEAQARRAAEQTVGNRGYSIIACDWHARRNLHRLCFLIRLPTQKGRRFPPDVCAARKRRGGFCAFAKQACARIGRIHKIGGQPSRLPPYFQPSFRSLVFPSAPLILKSAIPPCRRGRMPPLTPGRKRPSPLSDRRIRTEPR